MFKRVLEIEPKSAVLLVLCLLGLSFTLLEVLTTPTLLVLSVTFYSILALALIFLPLFPLAASWFILGFSAVMAVFSQTDEIPVILGAVIIGLGIITFCYKSVISVPALLWTLVISGFTVWANYDRALLAFISAAAILIAVSIVAKLAYLTVEYMNRKEVMLRRQLELTEIHHNELKANIAMQLHDSLTNALSNISLLLPHEQVASGRVQESAKGEVADSEALFDAIDGVSTSAAHEHKERSLQKFEISADKLENILNQINRSYSTLHGLLNYLQEETNGSLLAAIYSHDPDRGLSDGEIDLRQHLSSLLAEQTNLLDQAGYFGSTAVKGNCFPTDQGRVAAVSSLLVEICNNISRHALRGQEVYDIDVTITHNEVIIRSTNDIATDRALNEYESSGQGIAMHQRRFNNLGGKITHRNESGFWMLFARLPLDSSANNSASRENTLVE